MEPVIYEPVIMEALIRGSLIEALFGGKYGACNTRASISMRIRWWYTLTERSRYFVPASGHYVSAYSERTRARENKAFLIGNP